MTTFSHGSLITSMLQKVNWEWKDYPLIGDGDLNATITQLFKSTYGDDEEEVWPITIISAFFFLCHIFI